METKVKPELKYFVFYKPYNVLNQFTKEQPDHITLSNFLKVGRDVYPLGRLDKDSEGLLILTNDTALNALLLSPSQLHKRSYFVQVEHDLTDQAITKISKGVDIKIETGDYTSKPCIVKKLQKAPLLPERNPPIRVRQNIPTSWALIELKEGKNRQVRKMFAAVGFPVLRLVRVQIEDLKLGKLEPGKFIELKGEEIYKLLKIDPTINNRKTKNTYGKSTEKTKFKENKFAKKESTKSVVNTSFKPKSTDLTADKPSEKREYSKPKSTYKDKNKTFRADDGYGRKKEYDKPKKEFGGKSEPSFKTSSKPIDFKKKEFDPTKKKSVYPTKSESFDKVKPVDKRVFGRPKKDVTVNSPLQKPKVKRVYDPTFPVKKAKDTHKENPFDDNKPSIDSGYIPASRPKSNIGKNKPSHKKETAKGKNPFYKK
ncbi:MAG: pseudouridine synthase [Saprospiraceae bacterium]|nr:pseudouridine synthase [Saprospiraceae bacterium]